MITIIEGPDCSGKTTLMTQGFRPGDGFVHEHCGPPPPSGAWGQYLALTQQFYNAKTMNVVLDRFLYGELIYRPILRPLSHRFTVSHVRMLERVLLSLQAVLIAAQTDYPTSTDIWQERHEAELITREPVLRAAWDGFRELFAGDVIPSLPVVEFDFQFDALDATLAKVAAVRPHENKGPGIGSWNPGKVVLLVGEEVNEQVAAHKRWPFVANSGSALWLAEKLTEMEVSEKHLYWINALTDGFETPGAFVEQLQPVATIALGTAAKTWCRKQRIVTEDMPHPAFWQRFKNKQRYPLSDLLPALLRTVQGTL